MRNFIVIFFLAFIFISCDRGIEIPKINTDKSTYTVQEEIKIWVEEFEDENGDLVIPDFYNWYIEDSVGNIVEDDFDDSITIFWTPQTSGLHKVFVEIRYNGNTTITVEKEINVD